MKYMNSDFNTQKIMFHIFFAVFFLKYYCKIKDRLFFALSSVDLGPSQQFLNVISNSKDDPKSLVKHLQPFTEQEIILYNLCKHRYIDS